MSGYKVVTKMLREEAKNWGERATHTQPVVTAVQGTNLSAPAFFVGDLSTLLPGAANAALEASQYEEFRAFIEKMLSQAVTEFNQIDVALGKIADEYDRVEGINEIDLDKFYHA